MKQTITGLGALLCAACAANGQLTLFTNGGSSVEEPGLGTGLITQSQVLARPGTLWSEVQTDSGGMANTVAGFAAHSNTGTGYRFADNFSVTGSQGWRVSLVTVYAYVNGEIGNSSPVSQVNVRIWNGRPGDPGSLVVFGDTATNRLVYAQKSKFRRVFASAASPQPLGPDATRPVWQIDADLGGVELPAGTYWLDWQFTPATAGAAVFCPPVTLVGARGKPGADARQFRNGLEGWVGLSDTGKPASATDVAQDLPFVVRGGVIPPSCIADFNGDGFIDGIDYDQFNNAFEQGLPPSDVNGDGFVDGIDYDLFNAAFEQGC